MAREVLEIPKDVPVRDVKLLHAGGCALERAVQGKSLSRDAFSGKLPDLD